MSRFFSGLFKPDVTMDKPTVRALIVSGVITVIVGMIVNYLAIPAWNLRSAGLWWFILWEGLVFLASLLVQGYLGDADMEAFLTCGKWWLIYLVVFAVIGIGSSPLFTARQLSGIADVTVDSADLTGDSSDFADMTAKENQSTLPLVDMDTAIMLGDKKVAGLNNASWYDVDNEYNLIKYQGKYYRLSTIDYGDGDVFKWSKAKGFGVPGYVLVPVTPENGAVTQESVLVTLDKPIKYTPGAFFGEDLSRHLRNQYPSYIFDKSFMEIDESGVPYWVTGVQTPTAGLFGGKVVNSFILTDASTGESKEYSIDNAPDWIDHIYSLDYLMDVAYWHYAYSGGFWNSIIGQVNVRKTTYCYKNTDTSKKEGAEVYALFYGYSSVINRDGEVCFYTGLTPANRSESNLGWLLIDTSTGKMKQYDLVCVEEGSAQNAVEQLVQEKGYQATFPIPVNIGGTPSYVMCLKGKAGLVQSYAICNTENYSIAVEAETLPLAIQKYQAKLNGTEMPSGTTETTAVSPIGDIQSGSGKISEIYTAELNGTTQFYYVIDGELYRSSITVDERQILLNKGESISFEYYVSGDIRVITKIV